MIISKSDSAHPLTTECLHFNEAGYSAMRHFNQNCNIKTKPLQQNEFLAIGAQDIADKRRNCALNPFLWINISWFLHIHRNIPSRSPPFAD